MGNNIDLSNFAPRAIKIKSHTARRGTRPPVNYLLQTDGKQFIARRQIQSLSGKVGHGKTTFGLCLMVACACGKFGPIETTSGGPIKALWIDTEQGIDLLIERYEQVLKIAGIDHLTDTEINYKRLKAISLAEYNTIKEMKSAIGEEVSTMQPDFIFIDGIADLVMNINDIEEAYSILKWVKDLAINNNCAVMCMTHINKSASNGKGDKLGGIQGNVGSFLARKAFDSFVVEKVEKTDDLRTILHEKTRTYNLLDPLYMTATMVEKALEITLTTEKPLPKIINEFEQENARKAILIEAVRKVGKPLISNIRSYLHEIYKYSQSKANVLIDEGGEKGWIEKKGNLYRVVENPEQSKTEGKEEPEKPTPDTEEEEEDPL